MSEPRVITLDRDALRSALYLDRSGEMRPARAMLEEIQHVAEVVRLAILPDGGEGDVSIARALQFITRIAEFGCLLDDASFEEADEANQIDKKGAA